MGWCCSFDRLAPGWDVGADVCRLGLLTENGRALVLYMVSRLTPARHGGPVAPEPCPSPVDCRMKLPPFKTVASGTAT